MLHEIKRHKNSTLLSGFFLIFTADPKTGSPGSAKIAPPPSGNIPHYVGVNPATVTLYSVFSPPAVIRRAGQKKAALLIP